MRQLARLARAAILIGAALSGAASAAGQAPPPPRTPPPPAPFPPGCVMPRETAEYVPGADVKGRPIPPADLPGQGGVEVSTEIYAELRSRNPGLRGAGVVANLPGLIPRPPCRPPPALRR